ncbi:inverse autotransporter beta domain-containing protein [Salmonella enterica subsp. enterica]|nr:inverse autotransporter beta domain-containing protein [Salmonella enterica subsp. enterica]
MLDENPQRAGFGAEAWEQYFGVYPPTIISLPIKQTHYGDLRTAMARGYDINAQVRLPCNCINTVSLEQ